MNTKSLSFLTDPLDPPQEAPKNVLPAFPKPGKNKETPPPKEVLPQAESPQDLPTGTAVVEATPSENVQNQTAPSSAEFQIIPLDRIDPPAISQRQIYTREMVDNMAHAIRRQGKGDNLAGQISPIVVAPHPSEPGRYQIIDGFTRYQAFVDHYLAPHIKASIRTGLTEKEKFQMAFSANVERNDTSDYDRGMALAQAFRDGVYKEKTEVAAELGVDKVTVGGLLAYVDFPEPLLEIIRTDPARFSHNFAYRLQTLINKEVKEDELVTVARKIRDGNLSLKKFGQFVSDYQGPTERPKRSRRDTRSIMGYGKVKATDNAVQVDLASLPQDIAPKLVDSLEKFITEFLRQNIPSEQTLVGDKQENADE